MRKYFLAMSAIGFLVFVFLCDFAIAADVKKIAPEFNPVCWKEDECAKTRESVFGVPAGEGKSGWLKGDGDCSGEGWGKCLPAGKTKTQVAFGGKTEFKDIGDFLKNNYNYAIGIAAILATIMMVIAGAQWVTSGGNSEAIGGAKKRIGGALIGLLIAYLSYTILNTINPALVNIRLPQVFLLKTQRLVPDFCAAMKGQSDTKFRELQDGETQESLLASPAGAIKYDLAYDEKKFTCGKKYLIAGAGMQTCAGDYCEDGNVCIPFEISNSSINPGQPNCVKGQLAVHYKMDNSIESLLEQQKAEIPFAGIIVNQIADPWLDISEDDAFVFEPLCRNEKDAGSYYSNTSERWDGGDEGFSVYTIKKFDYLVIYDNLVGGDSAYPDMDAKWCEDGEKVDGWILRNQIMINWDGKDKNIFVGKGKSGNGGLAAFGKWNYHVNSDNIITIKDLEKGLYLTAELDGEKIKLAHDCKDQDLWECCNSIWTDSKEYGAVGPNPEFCKNKGGD